MLSSGMKACDLKTPVVAVQQRCRTSDIGNPRRDLVCRLLQLKPYAYGTFIKSGFGSSRANWDATNAARVAAKSEGYHLH